MTLNQIIARINKLALNHKQINDFRFGNIVEWLSNGEIKYPACFVDINNATISRTTHENKFIFNIWLCDLMNVAEDSRLNEIDVMSDLTVIMQDLTALINDPAYDDEWTIESDYQLTYAKEKFEDDTLALMMSITISSDYLNDRCIIPIRN